MNRADIIKKAGLRFDRRTSFGEDHLFSLGYILRADSISASSATGYNYMMGSADSLAHKVVKNEEMLFYLTESDRLFDRIAEKTGNGHLAGVFDTIRARNTNRAVKNFFRGKGKLEEYRRFAAAVPGNFRRMARRSESPWGRITCLLLGFCPVGMSYLIFRNML